MIQKFRISYMSQLPYLELGYIKEYNSVETAH
jgi:hypothetical protein